MAGTANEKKDTLPAAEKGTRPEDSPAYWEELVDYEAPLIGPDGKEGPVFVGVNGETLLIRRGETVKVKRKFLEALRLSDAARREGLRNAETARLNRKKPLAEW